MAMGAVARSAAQVAVAVSGVAGPGGGSVDKPVGTVCFGFALPDGVSTETVYFRGDRESVRRQSVAHVLTRLIERLA
jgi:nicotinamide-nucleotide amidase